MNRRPKSLQAGDHIRILAPAKAIEAALVERAKSFLIEKGFEVSISDHCLGNYHYFSGTIEERLRDLQEAMDDDKVDAIWCARGGYGCIQLVDRLNWVGMIRSPKWVIGFSDITFLHQRLHRHRIQSIHGTMPLNFESNSEESFGTVFDALFDKDYSIQAKHNRHNKFGTTTGTLIGGNLSILYANIGTQDALNYDDSILFIEEVSEPLYAIDRIFHALSRSGVLDKIRGLIVGGMSHLSDSEVPYGNSLEEIVLSHFEYRKIPVGFDVPAGHIDDNRAMTLGAEIRFDVSPEGSNISFSSEG